MNLLLHICCGPCAIYPLKELRTHGHDVTGLFYNPNIHPYLEYQRRRQTLQAYAEKIFLKVIWPDGYLLEEFLRQVSARPGERCAYCLTDRLRFTAEEAKNGGYDGFTSTLLYSRYQKHDLIREIGESLGRRLGIEFFYSDFRQGWTEGVGISRELGMYRQPYCGCIYSEKDRYFR
ncbi:MAG: epoxyqueuosine reductase QueH [Smithellaceae bacterium]|nr:epoxyqueuosine reductase QueH [Syntrophaceae bacterium]MDD4241948.1 epoxyqueuosine reductase QueH [Smithellaceae bacterium]NLX53023.1 epoxyqueuosine reductase QueH [Deltaproteobacteria bacterium]